MFKNQADKERNNYLKELLSISPASFNSLAL